MTTSTPCSHPAAPSTSKSLPAITRATVSTSSPASGNIVTLANDSDLNAAAAPFNTLTGPPPANLVGDSIAIHRHRTLDETFPPEDFGATDSQATADQVQIFAGGAWTIYWLYNENDADPLTSRWVDAADAGMADKGGDRHSSRPRLLLQQPCRSHHHPGLW